MHFLTQHLFTFNKFFYVGYLQVKWLHLLYNNFTAFSRDQEHLISFSERNEIIAADYVEGMLLLNQPPLDLSFYAASDQQRITTLVTQYGIVYILELVKYYDNNSQAHINEVTWNKCFCHLISYELLLFFLFILLFYL